jgi:hypothetical protein
MDQNGVVTYTPWLRAEVLRVLHKFCGGMPVLTSEESIGVAIAGTHKRDLRFALWVQDEDLDLINACLEVEHELREDAFAALEELLMWCQFSDGSISERIHALPDRAFTSAMLDLYEIGWI